MPEESPAGQNAAASKSNERKAALLQQIENSFTYHSPKNDQPARYEALRAKAKELALLIVEMVPDSRERALAITNLEQSIMWANKGVACNE